MLSKLMCALAPVLLIASACTDDDPDKAADNPTSTTDAPDECDRMPHEFPITRLDDASRKVGRIRLSLSARRVCAETVTDEIADAPLAVIGFYVRICAERQPDVICTAARPLLGSTSHLRVAVAPADALRILLPIAGDACVAVYAFVAVAMDEVQLRAVIADAEAVFDGPPLVREYLGDSRVAEGHSGTLNGAYQTWCPVRT
jgi:hypothetical protein